MFGNFSSLNQLDIYDGKILSKNTVLFQQIFCWSGKNWCPSSGFFRWNFDQRNFRRNNGTSGNSNRWFVFVITTIGILYEKVLYLIYKPPTLSTNQSRVEMVCQYNPRSNLMFVSNVDFPPRWNAWCGAFRGRGRHRGGPQYIWFYNQVDD